MSLLFSQISEGESERADTSDFGWRLSIFTMVWLVCSQIACHLYMPYYHPAEDRHVYSWIWKPVTYSVDPDEWITSGRSEAVGIEAFFNDTIEIQAHWSLRRAHWNALYLFLVGLAVYTPFAITRECRRSREAEEARLRRNLQDSGLGQHHPRLP